VTFRQLVREALDAVQQRRRVSEEVSLKANSLSHELQTFVDQAEA
jgi:hypothetical protein